jgi:hypothetical protein
MAAYDEDMHEKDLTTPRMKRRSDSLRPPLQIGRNPYMPCKPTQLHILLAAVAEHVRSGVRTYGVDGLDAVFQDVDTEGGRDCYTVPLRNSSTEFLLHLLFDLRAVVKVQPSTLRTRNPQPARRSVSRS